MQTSTTILNATQRVNPSLESRVRRKSHARFGEGSWESTYLRQLASFLLYSMHPVSLLVQHLLCRWSRRLRLILNRRLHLVRYSGGDEIAGSAE